MRAIRIHQPGGPEALRLDELPTPSPGPGQVLVEVRAAGVNFIDVYQRSGQYRITLPGGIGLEGAGVVKAVGAGVELAAGTRVAWAAVPGSYASHLVAPIDSLVAFPDGISFEQAAAAMLQGMTAHYLSRTTYRLRMGDTCVVHAAAGGVGLLLCQMARRAGARVIATTSTAAKAERSRFAGAAEVVLYDQDVAAEVRRLTDGRGADVVYDSVGKTTFAASLAALKPRGLLVLYGQSSGAVPPFDLQLLNQHGGLYLTRPSLHHYTATRAELLARVSDVLGQIAHQELTLTIDRTLPLDQAAEAHRLLESRQTVGKLLLVP